MMHARRLTCVWRESLIRFAFRRPSAASAIRQPRQRPAIRTRKLFPPLGSEKRRTAVPSRPRPLVVPTAPPFGEPPRGTATVRGVPKLYRSCFVFVFSRPSVASFLSGGTTESAAAAWAREQAKLTRLLQNQHRRRPLARSPSDPWSKTPPAAGPTLCSPQRHACAQPSVSLSARVLSEEQRARLRNTREPVSPPGPARRAQKRGKSNWKHKTTRESLRAENSSGTQGTHCPRMPDRTIP